MNVVDADLLVVGAGSAGLWAAHRFAELCPNMKVCIVDKGPASWGGLMAMAGGDFEAVLPGDTLDGWLEDFVYYFDGLCDQPLMAEMLARSKDRFGDYQSFGCEFFHNPDGSLKSVPQRGLTHVKLYPAQQKGRGGELMARALTSRLRKHDVQFFGRTMLTEFIKKNDTICGASGFNCITGECFIFRARAVIAASGMGGWKTSYGKNTPTGDGLRMAWDAGLTLQNMEFARVWNMPRLFAWEGQTHLFPLGARFVNRLGENFMARYSPILGPNTDPHYTTIGMALEISEGRGPIIFDVSPLKPGDMAILKPNTGWQKLNYDKLCKMGLDIFQDNTEWVPQITVSHGGIAAGVDGSTELPGFFVAGTARSLEPGVYAGGFALMTTAVTGYMAAETAAAWLENNPEFHAEFSNIEMEQLGKAILEPMLEDVKIPLAPKTVLTRIQSVIFPWDVSIVKNGKKLEAALEEIRRIRNEDVPRMVAENPHYLMKLKEVEAIALVSELFLRASLMRRESRGGHYRSDYPDLSPDGPEWIFVKKGFNGNAESRFEKVPLDKYQVPLTRCYQDNFLFPGKKQRIATDYSVR